MRDMAGSAAPPTARCKNSLRWGSFMTFPPEMQWNDGSRAGDASIADDAEVECKLLRFDIRKLDHPGPLLGFGSDELPKLRGRTGKHRAAQVNKSRPDLGIGEGRVN